MNLHVSECPSQTPAGFHSEWIVPLRLYKHPNPQEAFVGIFSDVFFILWSDYASQNHSAAGRRLTQTHPSRDRQAQASGPTDKTSCPSGFHVATPKQLNYLFCPCTVALASRQDWLRTKLHKQYLYEFFFFYKTWRLHASDYGASSSLLPSTIISLIQEMNSLRKQYIQYLVWACVY